MNISTAYEKINNLLGKVTRNLKLLEGDIVVTEGYFGKYSGQNMYCHLELIPVYH